ncbi:hypothetical protein SUGI_0830960 [Cryptomeria japonica]|nr:hypothetical protein SUGI_0830960 [Cryptomeria japonica]
MITHRRRRRRGTSMVGRTSVMWLRRGSGSDKHGWQDFQTRGSEVDNTTTKRRGGVVTVMEATAHSTGEPPTPMGIPPPPPPPSSSHSRRGVPLNSGWPWPPQIGPSPPQNS